MHIAVCDDESAQREYLYGVIERWAQHGEHSVRLSAFSSAEAFLFAYEADKSFDILTLDIQMGGISGVELAKKLRESDERLQIIFVTGYADFISEGYDVSALHYLMKPISEEKLCTVLSAAASRLGAAPRSVLLPQGRENIRVLVDDILFGEVFSHSVKLHTVGETIDLSMSLGELETLLGEGFLRCHRSYIVGLKKIKRIARGEIVLDSGAAVPLARGMYDKAMQAFIKAN